MERPREAALKSQFARRSKCTLSACRITIRYYDTVLHAMMVADDTFWPGACQHVDEISSR